MTTTTDRAQVMDFFLPYPTRVLGQQETGDCLVAVLVQPKKLGFFQDRVRFLVPSFKVYLDMGCWNNFCLFWKS